MAPSTALSAAMCKLFQSQLLKAAALSYRISTGVDQRWPRFLWLSFPPFTVPYNLFTSTYAYIYDIWQTFLSGRLRLFLSLDHTVRSNDATNLAAVKSYPWAADGKCKINHNNPSSVLFCPTFKAAMLWSLNLDERPLLTIYLKDPQSKSIIYIFDDCILGLLCVQMSVYIKTQSVGEGKRLNTWLFAFLGIAKAVLADTVMYQLVHHLLTLNTNCNLQSFCHSNACTILHRSASQHTCIIRLIWFIHRL